ncbi:carboxypeptidase regulatory-like domain-containing protein [Candidatus Woesebacteria bacterium]|nr:carboxypeptidase regulatory-like domain-containing protein [Candidatus Woesebacteria bacterium]
MLHHLRWSRSIAVFLMTVCLGIFVVGISISAGEVHASHDAPLLPTATPTTYYPWGIQGTVTDEQGNPLSGALVRMTTDYSYTQWDGKYTFGNVAPGSHEITVEYYGSVFTPTVRTVTVPPSAENVDFQKLPPVTTHSIFGRITDHTGTGVPFVKITTDYGEYVSDAGGSYTIHGLLAGTHHVTATSESMVFTPTVQTVTLPQEAPQSVNFTQMCESPNTGLNVCILEPGDILFLRGGLLFYIQDDIKEYLAPFVDRIFLQSYWWHTAIYLGSGEIAEAIGRGIDIPIDEEVKVNSIYNTSWWLTGEFDWSVRRPLFDALKRHYAAQWAREQAEKVNPPLLYAVSILDFFDSELDGNVYCNEFVWAAYNSIGEEIQHENGFIASMNPLLTNHVSADELFEMWYYNQESWVDDKQTDTGEDIKRSVLHVFSPADLLLSNAQGAVGYDPTTGELYNSLDSAYYTGPDPLGSKESIAFMVSGEDTPNYYLKVTGTGSGEYTLSLYSFNFTNFVTSTATLTTSVGQIDVFDLTVLPMENETAIVHVDTILPPMPTWRIYLPFVSK